LEENICIAVVTNKAYEKYVPYFVWAVKRSYPKYAVKVFCLSMLSQDVKNILKSLCPDNGVEIVEMFFSELPSGNQELKSFRWLIPKQYFCGYEYVYIGDIDMLICKESPSLLEQHKMHCNNNQLPYSNCVRPNTKRLTGLHFFKTEPYYEKMGKIIEKYTKMLKDNKLALRLGVRNEEVLYNMVVDAGISLPADELRIDINGSGPHHGLHLGIWRSRAAVKSAVIDQIIKDSYLEHFDYFSKVSKQEDFLSLEKKFPLKELSLMRSFFETYKER
jgi:hypothetical protein